MRYLGYALAGRPYIGIGRNMAYRKELFYAQKGFSAHLDLQRGDDDLFINKAATPETHVWRRMRTPLCVYSLCIVPKTGGRRK